ncbi:glycosyltransferase [Aggregatimonas sangjinii]|uniref:Glycosyltransferase n=1 Tax=Aggregatimonas sangjinii TaxID=2583587 RepID=A0A5B7SKY2_9FLAO|nr:TIGR04283 family arsenosugar biosynthesis glycosyltransferase [Aggregatimonas sangjinii]QCW98701.1 glycosyltransferase [Aggregatimonas sangjinii]
MIRSPYRISVIIPVFNEEAHIVATVRHLQKFCANDYIEEILIVDGGSTDNTLSVLKNTGATVLNAPKGRAVQMNYGAAKAKGSILYFLHADTLPPKDFGKSIVEAVLHDHQAGCFQMIFDSDSRFLEFFAWFSRLNIRLCRGGDQSLFITKKLFQALNGFNEDYHIYEDNEFIGRLYKHTPFKILPQRVKTSARRYEKHGKIKLQYHFGMIHLKSRLGAGPDQLYQYYRQHIA